MQKDSNLKLSQEINMEESGPASNIIIKVEKKSRKWPYYLLAFFIIIFTLFSLIAKSANNANFWFYNLPIISQLKHLAESSEIKLKGEDSDRINLVLLGMGGKNHDGGFLTDTIMLASLQPSTKKIALISIPRDLIVPIESLGWRKINNVNAFAEQKNPGSGGLAISQTLSDILKIPVDYYVRLDFTGFEKIIDDLGGINVNVENTLDDYKYPILGNEDASWNNRFEHLHIDKGPQEMDGNLALKYVRSRHAYGAEGSDFARARRQQLVIQAVKEKLMSAHVLLNPTTIGKIIGDIQDNFSSNLKIWEMVKLWSMFKDANDGNIVHRVLDNSPNGLLADSIGQDGAYILTPRSGDFSEIQYLANNIFTEAPPADKIEVSQEKATVEVRNGTWINGLANRVGLDLEKYGFAIARIGNSSQQNFQKSVIYDLTYGDKIQSLTVLKNITKANVSLGLPEWLTNDLKRELIKEKNTREPDFILILGRDADTTGSGSDNIVQ